MSARKTNIARVRERVRQDMVEGLRRDTQGAFSYDRYGEDEWVKCISLLLALSYTLTTAEAILDSKHMRHAADIHGSATHGSLLAYIQHPATRHYFGTVALQQLVEASE